LERLGFELRRTGPRHIVTHTLPRLLADGPAEDLLSEVLRAASAATQPPFGIDAEALIERLSKIAGATLPRPAPSALDAEDVEAGTVRSLLYDDIR
jgi:hypothetical protein